MSRRGNLVMLSVWVSPSLRECARSAAKAARVPLSTWVGHVVEKAVARASEQHVRELRECGACGHDPCACDQQ